MYYICIDNQYVINKLSLERQTKIINTLVECGGIRSTARLQGCSVNTVVSLLIKVGEACVKFHDEKVRNIHARKIQCDEMWSFVYAKEKNLPREKASIAGDVWTWVAIDADTKLIVSWAIGDRDAFAANMLMDDLASRLANKVQLTTDGHRPYLEAVENNFGGNIDYAQLVKIYGKGRNPKYQKFIGITKTKITGNPDEQYISTNAVERQNLTMRTHIRRLTRRTNAHSKKIENHAYAVALHFVYYNFCKIHGTLRVTPAMEAGLTKDIMEIEDIVKLAN